MLQGISHLSVPAIYLGDPSASESMFAYVPGLANLQVWNEQVWLPKPFGPRSAGTDVFESAVEAELSGLTVHFIDDWDGYHRDYGEVHCGTNVIRVGPPEHQRWWDNLSE